MKNLLLIFITSFLLVNISFANIEDNSIIDELNKDEVKELQVDFNLNSFESCQNMEDVMGKYINDYWKNNKKRYIYEPRILYSIKGASVDMIAEDGVPQKKSISNDLGGAEKDYSKTNTQVEGVDEADIIKTDGDYIYYYNSKGNYNEKKYIYIVDSKDSKNLKIVKKIKVPGFFNNTQLYVSKNRLTILASGYSQANYKRYWINRAEKTYSIIYDTSSKEKPVLKKLYITDGRLSKSRKIGKYLYVVSNNYFNIPYYTFKNEDDIKIEINNIIPKKIDISKTNTKTKQNLRLRGKTYPFNITAGNVAKCNEIEYVLPDSETIKKFDFNPSYNIISIIDTENTEKEVKTKVIAGNSSEIYMSTKNLYLTDRMYSPYNYSCPKGAMCIMPFYYGGTTNTLIHKLNISGNNLSYKTSNIIPGSPLNQYSMDEKDDKFRIITQTRTWTSKNNKSHTDLYILDKNLKLYSSVKNLGEDENFQSSRFMGDKLFLVTFKQIDPLYVIDLKDQKNPKVIGELKIPGYSTYLHPYDENNLIGLGYDTFENKWGGTRNGGFKVDLYSVDYNKKDSKGNIEVKQKFTKTFGDAGSYTEALNNPRMFMWNSKKNLLLLPSQIKINENKESYKAIDFFQGLLALNIDKNIGIKEEYRISHIDTTGMEEQREKECTKYTKKESEPKCRKTINGEEICIEPQKYNYIPEYCFADSTIGSYIASQSYKFRYSFISRALWIDNTSFAISNNKITSHNLNNGKRIGEVNMR